MKTAHSVRKHVLYVVLTITAGLAIVHPQTAQSGDQKAVTSVQTCQDKGCYVISTDKVA